MDLPDPLITISPDYLSGAPIFTGTRVPVQALFDYIEGGDPLDEFLEDFPNVTKEHAVAVLEMAQRAAVAEVARTSSGDDARQSTFAHSCMPHERRLASRRLDQRLALHEADRDAVDTTSKASSTCARIRLQDVTCFSTRCRGGFDVLVTGRQEHAVSAAARVVVRSRVIRARDARTNRLA